MEHTIKKERITFTDQMRARFKGTLDTVGKAVNRLGIPPNTVTLLGVAGNFIGAVFLAQGKLTLGGIIILAMGPIDALDGTMARLRGESSEWGAFVDSVADRYSELVIYGGLLLFYLLQGNLLDSGLVYLAASGSVLVSYVRARAQSLGFDVKGGLFTRLERYLVLAPSLVLNLPLYGLAILAVGTHLTSLQRIWAMRSQARKDNRRD